MNKLIAVLGALLLTGCATSMDIGSNDKEATVAMYASQQKCFAALEAKNLAAATNPSADARDQAILMMAQALANKDKRASDECRVGMNVWEARARSDAALNQTIQKAVWPVVTFGIVQAREKSAQESDKAWSDAYGKTQPSTVSTTYNVSGDDNTVAHDRSSASVQRDVAGSASASSDLNAPSFRDNGLNADNGAVITNTENNGKQSQSNPEQSPVTDNDGGNGLF